jgi:hypothetical protein
MQTKSHMLRLLRDPNLKGGSRHLTAVCMQNGHIAGQRPQEEATFVTTPTVCSQAIQERKAQELALLLEYSNAELTIELVDLENVQDAPSKLFCIFQDMPRGPADSTLILKGHFCTGT